MLPAVRLQRRSSDQPGALCHAHESTMCGLQFDNTAEEVQTLCEHTHQAATSLGAAPRVTRRARPSPTWRSSRRASPAGCTCWSSPWTAAACTSPCTAPPCPGPRSQPRARPSCRWPPFTKNNNKVWPLLVPWQHLSLHCIAAAYAAVRVWLQCQRRGAGQTAWGPCFEGIQQCAVET